MKRFFVLVAFVTALCACTTSAQTQQAASVYTVAVDVAKGVCRLVEALPVPSQPSSGDSQ